MYIRPVGLQGEFTMIARVCAVIAASIFSIGMSHVRSSTGTRTGVAPFVRIMPR